MKIIANTLKTSGQFLLRYGLALTLIWIGLLKFKNSEADYLKQILADSSIFSWTLKYLTSYAFSQIIAWLQIIIGILIAIKPVARKVSFWGGLAAVLLFLFSVSALFTSGYVWQVGYGFPELSKVGQSILKDLVLLGAAAWCTGDSA